ncbi:uncharacterized protein OCT59_029304 [Rhizophagus irregularis]|uniref:Uncharacterized protein n=1 Tax=Rhizophagus irregularis TaxID=588596 RepID=A0A915ZTY6_9GLOM|nr:hypothetical protein OCT59_029304 [Rhizophagus irregularis]GET64964.1 hypothetical protein GLOIN_2v1879708 [Rhizophagus irregularis DAOM 181602=DAOM 197198]CAB4480921.1 unnamed protein product [Rhizophagus irregularis]CAB5388327.1 unnamed protein product [Rhizophagus irregularis]
MSNVSFFYRERWTKLQSNYGMAGSRFSRRSELGRNMLSIVTIPDNFLRFLDDSWTIRDRFLDDLNNIIFFMISG